MGSKSSKQLISSRWRPFKEAREYVRSLGLKNREEWSARCKSGNRPDDIPHSFHDIYGKHTDWKGLGDFLGTGFVATQNRSYRPFKEARDYVQSLGLKNQKEWIEHCNSGNCPDDVPRSIWAVYVKHPDWKGLGDFLGTGFVATQNRSWRPFNEAREYARSLGLKSQKEWAARCKSGNRPDDIPHNLLGVYGNHPDWKGLGDFLGTSRSYRPFKEAREYARSLGLKSQKEWVDHCKIENCPDDISLNVYSVYAKHPDWRGFGDFLGNGNVSPSRRSWRPFNEAREYARSLGLKSQKEWVDHCKSENCPDDISRSVYTVYAKHPDWKGLGDFLGTGFVATQNRSYRSFKEAREYVRSLGLKNEEEWAARCKSENCPDDIPRSIREVYGKHPDWRGISDFLGNGNVSPSWRSWRPFNEAREYARSLGLTSPKEWVDHCKSENCPDYIPHAPGQVYGDDWKGFQDFLGFTNKWTVTLLRHLLKQLLDDGLIELLAPAQLLAIISAEKLLTSRHWRKLTDKLISAVADQSSEALQQVIDDLGALNDGDADDDDRSSSYIDRDITDRTADDYIDAEDDEAEQEPDEPELPSIRVRNLLRGLGSSAIKTDNKQTTEYLIRSSVSQLWSLAFDDEDEAVAAVRDCTTEQGKKTVDKNYRLALSDQVRDAFLKEYDEVKALKLPPGYASPIVPNLMQWLIAARVRRDRRVGNWSGAGAGKTLSAILSSGLVRSRFTIISCPNNTVQGWVSEIRRTYPRCEVQFKTFTPEWEKTRGRRYLVLNHEMFQQPATSELIDVLLEQQTPDFIVVDEVQAVKQRYKDATSRRKEMMDKLVRDTGSANPKLRVLGMSATPVINNLQEAKSLIELVLGEDQPDIPVRSTVMAAHAVHQRLSMLGIRYKPNYDMVEEITIVPVDCTDGIDKLLGVTSDYQIERAFAVKRIPEILKLVKKKTLIYTQKKTGFVAPLLKALRAAGWKAGEYSGDVHTDLNEFIEGDLDVLVGTDAIATGTDGLQRVCDRLIIFTLPWTAALFDQIRGRVFRQGQSSKKVEIFITSAYADTDNGRWEWDKLKLRRLKHKSDLASAAVDGEIADKNLITPARATHAARRLLARMTGETAREKGVCRNCKGGSPNFDGLCDECRPAALRALDYRTGYLFSEWWVSSRAMMLKIYKHKCAECETRKRLTVHHETYERLGEELPEDLVVLCWDCHQAVHS